MPDKDRPDLDSAYALETPDGNLQLYRDWAESYDAEFVEATTYRFPELVTRAYRAAGGGWPCLDAGCGTGALAEHFPDSAVIDGLDLSPEMLAVARRKGRYRALIEANLKEALPLPDAAYSGLVSSGTFTHGHVGPEALPELIRILAADALAVLTVRPHVWDGLGFGRALEDLAAEGRIGSLARHEETIYAVPERAPPGHAQDTGYIVQFRRA